MNYSGILVGIATFLLIGIFHPIVVKAEYYFTKKIWPLFLIAGMGLLISALFITSDLVNLLVSVLGICFLWSIGELFEQEERVNKGWFPKRPDKNQQNLRIEKEIEPDEL